MNNDGAGNNYDDDDKDPFSFQVTAEDEDCTSGIGDVCRYSIVDPSSS